MERIDSNGKWIVENGVSILIEPTQEWIEQNQPVPTRDELLIPIRIERDRLLDEADVRYCNAERWELMTDEQKQAWRDYKQALRDLPLTVDVDNPIYPTKPE